MGELIEFYVPASFNYSRQKWIPESARGKVIAFRMAGKVSIALSQAPVVWRGSPGVR